MTDTPPAPEEAETQPEQRPADPLEEVTQRLTVEIQTTAGEPVSDLRAREILGLMDMVAKITSPTDLEQVLQATAEQVSALLDVEACAISRWDKKERATRLWIEHAPAEWEPDPEWYQPYPLRDYPLTQEVLKTGHPIQIRIDESGIDPAERQFMRQNNLQTLLMMPLTVRDRTVGLVELMDRRTARTFTQHEINLALLLSAHAAIAIERANLLEEAKQRAAQLEALYRASLSLTASLELTQVLDAILKSTLALIPGLAGAHIFLYQEGRLSFGAAVWEGRKRGAPFAEPRRDGLTYTVARTGEPLVVPDMGDHPLYKDAPAGWGGSIVGLPLKIGDQVVGVMNVANLQAHAFTEAGLRVLRLLGDQAAIAIENARLHDLVRQQARTDTMTGLFNRRALDTRLAEEVSRAIRYQHPLSLIMMDLDDFKLVNDQYGHPVGDLVLKQVADCLADVVRDTDFLARFGGDEFSLLLPETSQAAAEALAARVLEAVEGCPLDLPDGRPLSLTFSMGLATFPSHADSATGLLVVADDALYRAKRGGPGRLEIASATSQGQD